MSWDWKTNDPLRTCSLCGQPVQHGNGWITVGLCELHEKMLREDIESGYKQDRIRDIMVKRGEVSEAKEHNSIS